MTKEQHILLDLICGNDAIEADGCDWQEVFELSCKQGVAGVAFDQVQKQFQVPCSKFQDSLATEVKLNWYAVQCQTEKRNRKVNEVLRRVVEVLAKQGIGSLLLKGQGLANLYEQPLHRQPGDIDLYVGAARYAEAKKVLSEQGWLSGEGVHEDVKHLGFSVDGVAVELHYSAAILPGRKADMRFQVLTSQALTLSSDGFFMDESGDMDALRGVFVGVLPLQLNVVYTFIHLYRHFIDEGVSLRQLMDWSLLVRKLKPSDFGEVEKLLRDFGFLKPWQVFGCLLVNELGLKAEELPCYDARYEKKAARVLEMMFDESNHQSSVTSHADTLGEKLRVLGDMAKNFGRVFWLFPKDYVAFTWLLLKSAAKKNLGFVH